MKILVDITHPADVHLFKYSIWNWQDCGHQIIITGRDKDVVAKLLDQYEFKYINLGPAGRGLGGVFCFLPPQYTP